MIDKIDNIFDLIKKPIYLFLIILVHLLYIITYFGILSYNVKYIDYLNIGIQLFICLFLIIRFHPFRKHHLKEFDANIIFGSAIYILINLGLTEYIIHYVNNVLEVKTRYHIF
jgi:hypothetical protein